MTEIKSIIFDLGGVILNLNYSKTEDEFKLRFTGTDFNFISITESWLTENDSTSTYDLPGYTMYRNDRTWKKNVTDSKPKGGGGLALYVNDRFRSSEEELSVYNYSCRDIETHCVLLKDMNDTSSIVCTIYRPPHGNLENFFEIIEPIINRLSQKCHKRLYVLGDFNINLLDPNLKEISNRLTELFMQYGLLNWIKKATRVVDKDSCLDLLFTNDYNLVKGYVIPFDLSDHVAGRANGVTKRDNEWKQV